MLTDRQKDLLKYIIEEYIETANPVGSAIIIKKYMTNISAATVRNEMAILEKQGYLEKNYTSSGRIPSTLGYKFYEKNFSKPYIDDDNLKLRLKKIFYSRNKSIESIIEESCKIITESTKLPIIKLEKEKVVLLKRVDLIEINELSAMVLVITSNGTLNKNIIQLKDKNVLKDVSICIRIFNDRLLDCPVDEIPKRLETIKNLIQKKVQEYEFVVQEVIERIFNIETKITKNIHNQAALLSVPEFQEKDKLKEILELLENTTIWEQIAFKQEKNGYKTSITFGDEIDYKDIVLAQTNIDILENSETKLVMVAPIRVNYSKMKGLLEFIKNEFEKEFKK